MEIRKNHKAEVPCFDFEKCKRKKFEELHVSEECGVVKYITIFLFHIFIDIQFVMVQTGPSIFHFWVIFLVW